LYEHIRISLVEYSIHSSSTLSRLKDRIGFDQGFRNPDGLRSELRTKTAFQLPTHLTMNYWTIVIALYATTACSAFVPLKLGVSAVQSRTRVEAGSSETLIFNADHVFVSEPFPASEKSEVASFFKKPEMRDLLLSAGGKRSAYTVPSHPDLDKLWSQACKDYYGEESLPRVGDVAISVETEIQFPGLKLVTTVLNGARLLENEETGLPEYEFVLIGDRKRSVGNPLVAWIFNQLTGSSNEAIEGFNPSETKAKSRVSIVENGSNDFSFKFDMEFETKISFSRVLLKILPASKEKMEEQGGAAMQKTVSGEVFEAVNALREQFLSSQAEILSL
jgi:hypothetical protein